MPTQRLKIKGSFDQLAANLDLPEYGKVREYALFAHCFTCSSQLAIVRNISKTLTSQGIAVLRFDFTGLGKSEGDFADTNFSSNVADLLAVHEFMTTNYSTPSILIGHSLGGAAVLAAAKHLTTIKAIATIGAPFDPAHVSHLFDRNLDQIKETGEASVNIGGRPFKIQQQFIDDIKNNPLNEVVGKLKIPYLILHSPQDTVVEIENAALLYKHAFHPKSFVSLDGADHLLTKKEDAIYAANIIATWMSRYFPNTATDAIATNKNEVVASLNNKDNYTTSIYAGKHQIVADEPASLGGDDIGMGPYELLSASLAACTAMTMKMYAKRKEWELENVTVHIEHSKGVESGANESKENGIKPENFSKKILIVGNLDAKQRQRLLQIASRCPVHRSLLGEFTIDTSEIIAE